jgi:predicted PurR-regulated permease PerM
MPMEKEKKVDLTLVSLTLWCILVLSYFLWKNYISLVLCIILLPIKGYLEKRLNRRGEN